MKTNELSLRVIRTLIFLFVCLSTGGWQGLLAQKSKDGAETYSTAGTYVANRYSALAASVSSGANSITVSNISDLAGSASLANATNMFSNDAIQAGDLILIIQVQGADISTADDATYGDITAYNNTGNYELLQVSSVATNTISICGTIANAYSQGGRNRSQVIRIPRLSTLTVSAGVTLSAKPWDGTSGGIIAIEASGNVVIDGTVSANAAGFRGGTDPSGATSSAGATVISIYRTTATGTSAGKGESIAGTVSDYASLNGANGRGAPANGGGGGNGHNAGGGGGANAALAGSLAGYNGTGTKPNRTTPTDWNAAWNLESAGFATNISPGGGRGGYTYSANNLDAITIAPGTSTWGGDFRDNVGGFGGRPLNNAGNTKVFLGGGGGGGDGNNSATGTGGGNGGGIIILLCNGSLSGSGSLTANGAAGGNTVSGHNDAPGGGGGGGSLILRVQSSISGISSSANGGNGGNQLITSSEAEGCGGGGGGGSILATTVLGTWTVNGGQYGATQSSSLTEFTPNGTTSGSPGTIAGITFSDVNCAVVPVRFTNVMAKRIATGIQVKWTINEQSNVSQYVVEQSQDGVNFSAVDTVFVSAAAVLYAEYSATIYDARSYNLKQYFRVRSIDLDGSFILSKVVAIEDYSSEALFLPGGNVIRRGELVLQINNLFNSNGSLRLIDVNGKVRMTKSFSLRVPDETLRIPLPASVSNGIYYVEVVSAMNRYVTKILVQR